MTGRKWLAAVTVLLVVETTAGALSPLLCSAASSAPDATDDCCPVGSHPKGMCPMHKPGTPASSARANHALPRWTCACAPVTIALLPAAPLTHAPTIVVLLQVSVPPAVTPSAPLDRLLVPASPPPRS